MNKPHVVILGAGPAGLGAAYRLACTRSVKVTVLEQGERVGGNAGSFELSGLPVDFGSHRLHPACDPLVLQDIRRLLADDLLDRPRHGRIRLRGRWIHFPLKPVDLALRLPPSFAVGVAADSVGKALHPTPAGNGAESFASLMERGLGGTICHDFYFPYARKIWGLEPEEISAIQARRRVSNNSLPKMFRKVLSALPGLKPKGSGRFFYPRQGYGQISEAYYRSALEAGAEIHLHARVKTVEIEGPGRNRVVYEKDGQEHALSADYVWSTIPIATLARILNPPVPASLLEAAGRIKTRAMVLIYLVLGQDQFSEYDAHYFPEGDIPITRLSEPKNYRGGEGPEDCTVLCAELPCSVSDAVWQQSEEYLGSLVCEALQKAGIPVKSPVLQVHIRRIRNAYPIYHQGYEAAFNPLDDWIGQIDGLLTFGRQGLFTHDNTHHALYMAYSAVECLDESGSFNLERWREYRKIFETHVVED